MIRALKIFDWLAFTVLPTFIAYLTNVGGVATSLDKAMGSLAPVVPSLLPFVAISGAAACLGFLVLRVALTSFHLMPRTVKLKFGFYLKQKVKELYPAIEEAISLDNSGRARSSLYSSRRNLDLRSRLKFIAKKLSDINVEVKESQLLSGVLVRDIAPFAEEGSYEDVRRLCERK